MVRLYVLGQLRPQRPQEVGDVPIVIDEGLDGVVVDIKVLRAFV